MSTEARRPQPGWLARHVPILDWGRSYNPKWLRTDLIAGVTVAALVVPKALGYAGIANVPIENGLYAAAAGTILYAIFGTSRQLSIGPSSSLAAVAGSAVALAAVTGDQEATDLVAAIAIATGVLFLVMALLRMSWISQFLSRAVITGFLFGAAIDVIVGELPKLTGTTGSGNSVWQEAISWVQGLGEIHWLTLAIGVGSLLILLAFERYARAIPGALVVVILGAIAAPLFDLESRGVAVVGFIPAGVPLPALPDPALVAEHLPIIIAAALGIVMIGFSQTAGDARFFANRHRYRVDIAQETVANGMANLASGLVRGIPVSTSLSASSLSDASGAKTAVASLATGAATLLTLLIFAPLFSELPKAVLGAVIIDAVVMGMIDVPEMRRLYRVKRFDFWIAVLAILGVLTTGVLGGIVIGVVLSVLWLIYVTATPAMPELGRAPGSHVFHELDVHPDAEQVPGHPRAAPRRRALLRDRGCARRPDPRSGGRRGRDTRPRRGAGLPGHRLHRLAGLSQDRRADRPGPRSTTSRSGSRGSSRSCATSSRAMGSWTGSGTITSTPTWMRRSRAQLAAERAGAAELAAATATSPG